MQNTLVKWHCGCLALLLDMSPKPPASTINNIGIQDLCTSGYEGGRSASDISTTLKLLASPEHEVETTCFFGSEATESIHFLAKP